MDQPAPDQTTIVYSWRIGTREPWAWWKDELIEGAKRDVIESITSNSKTKEEAARLLADDLAHARLLR